MPIRFQPTNLEKYPLQIVGESFYQDGLNNIVGLINNKKNQYKDDSLIANLIPDNDNPYDSNAVRIEIDSKIVGHLSRSNAIKYREVLRALGKSGEICQCCAAIYGKRDRETKIMNFGVWLDLDLTNISILSTSINIQEESKIKPNISAPESYKSFFNSIRSIFSNKKKK